MVFESLFRNKKQRKAENRSKILKGAIAQRKKDSAVVRKFNSGARMTDREGARLANVMAELPGPRDWKKLFRP